MAGLLVCQLQVQEQVAELTAEQQCFSLLFALKVHSYSYILFYI
jgi:hypothetical protein